MPNTPRGQQYREAIQNRAHAQLHRADTLGARRDPGIDSVAKLLEIDAPDEGLVDQFSVMLDRYEGEQRLNPNQLSPPPQADVLYGPGESPDFVIGTTIETGVPYGPQMADECGTIVLSGRPGGGKTTAVHHFVLGILACLIYVAILIIDPKVDASCLLSSGHKVVVAKAHEIRINVLKPPPGVDLQWWLRTVAHHFCEIRGLRKSAHLLLHAMLEVCRRFGVDKDPTCPWPSLVNVLQYLKTCVQGFGRSEYLQALITELHGLLDETGPIFDTCDGLSIVESILVPGTAFVLQIEMLPPAAQRFLVSVLVAYIFAYQMARDVHSTAPQILVIIDEAQIIMGEAADRATADGIAPLALYALRGREMGIGFIIVVHELAQISLAVLAAARILMIIGGLNDAADIQVAGRMMNLPPQALVMFTHLGCGEAIVRQSGHSFSDPFLVSLQPPPLSKTSITESMRRQLMAPILASLPATPSLPLVKDTKTKARQTVTATAEPGPLVPACSDRQLAVLRHCCEFPQLFSTERMPVLKVNDYHQFDGVVEQLAKLYLVTIHAPQLGSHKYTFIEVTDTGWVVAGMNKPAGYIGHGGFLHTVLIARVAEHLRQLGWQDVRTEHPVGPADHRVDIYGSQNDVRTGLEISLSLSNIADNARNSLIGHGAVQSLVFLCDVVSNCKKVKKILQKAPELQPYMDRIRVERIDQYISGTAFLT